MIDSSRNMVRVVILFFVVCMCFFSCQRKGVVNEQVLYWQDREILFPQKMYLLCLVKIQWICCLIVLIRYFLI